MNDMTSGSAIKKILLFSIPLMIGNVFQLLYNIADTYIVGTTMGVNALAGLGAAGSIVFFITGFSQGFSSGTAIPTAQAYGAHDYEKLGRSVAINWILTTIVVVLLSIVSVIFLWDILYFMNTPNEIIQYTYDYLVYTFGFMFVTLLFNMLSNLMRAVGDSRIPVVALIVGVIVNVLLVYLFILQFHMGTAGVAIATVIAQFISALICLWYIRRYLYILHVKKRHFQFSFKEVWQHCKIGFPMAFQSSIIAIGSMSVTVALNKLGAEAVAGFSAASKLDQVVVLFLTSFGVAIATYTGQNFGAKKYSRILEGIRKMSYISVAVAIICGIIIIQVGGEATSFFGDGESKDVLVYYGEIFFHYTGPFYWLLALLFIYRSALQGLGDSFIPTVAGVLELVMRVFAAFILSSTLGFVGPVLSSPMAWLGSLIALIPAFIRKRRELLKLEADSKQGDVYG